MIRFIHLSDVHIGLGFQSASFSETLSVKRAFEIKQTFFRALNYAKNEDIDFVIISGDLFEHEQIKKQEIEEIVSIFRSTRKDIFLISGNHDPMKNQSFWHGIDFPSNVHIFDQELSTYSIENLNIDLYAHSWSKYYYKDNPFKTLQVKHKDRYNILIAHGDAYNKKSDYLPIDISSLNAFDYVALGHIHKHDFLTPSIAYAGSLEPLSFKELGQHGFVEVQVSKQNVQTKFVPFSKREFELHKLQISTEDTIFSIVQRIQDLAPTERKSTNLFRIILEGYTKLGFTIDQSTLLEQLQEEFFYIELKDQTKVDLDIEAIKAQYKDHIIGKYIKRFEELGLSSPINYQAFLIGLEELMKEREGEQ